MINARTAFAVLLSGLLVTTGVAGVVGAQSSQKVTLTVTVVDSDGEAVGDIDLMATWDVDGGGSVNETTRANGQALIDVPDGARVVISVDDDRYVRNTPYVVENASTSEIEIPVTESGTATVEVVDSDGPVNAAVQLYSLRSNSYVANTRTGGNGQYTTQPIEQGQYRLTVLKSGYLRNRTTLTVDGDVTQQVELTQAARLVTFSVTDDHSDQPRPLSGATITVAGNTVTTVSNGEATLQLPVNGDYEAEVTKDGYETVTRSFSVDEGPVQQNISIQRTPTISVQSDQTQVVVGQSVRVTVTDEYDDPVENATLSIDDETVGETDETGAATIPIDSIGQNAVTATSGNLTATVTIRGVDPSTETPTDTATSTDTATPTDTSTPTANDTATEPQTTTEPTSITGPGFTGLTALVAVVLTVALLARRVRHP